MSQHLCDKCRDTGQIEWTTDGTLFGMPIVLVDPCDCVFGQAFRQDNDDIARALQGSLGKPGSLPSPPPAGYPEQREPL